MGETRLLAIDIQTAAGGPLEPASVYPPASAPKAERCNRSRPVRSREIRTWMHISTMRDLQSRRKLRRMRVQN